MPNRAREFDICQFLTLFHAPQHKSASAHVASANEVVRKAQALLKCIAEDTQILGSRDASKKNSFAVQGDRLSDSPGISFEGVAVARVSLVNLDAGDLLELVECENLLRRSQTTSRSYYQRSRKIQRRVGKVARIG